MKKHINLFIAFFRSGMLGFGGGPSAIPLVQKEVVDIFKWMDNDEFSDILALANTLPGPINTKMAGYIGYRVAGILGMITAIASSIIPTIFLMILFLSSLTAYKDQPWVSGMTKGVIPVVMVMLAVLTWQFFKKSKDDLGWKQSLFMLIGSLLLIEFLNVHPGIVIAVILLVVLCKPTKAKKKNEKEGRELG